MLDARRLWWSVEKCDWVRSAVETKGRTDMSPRTDDSASVVVVIPTYNERENLRQILERIHKATPCTAVLVVDDNSPDGTGEIADDLARADERIHVLHRPIKAGLGSAYLDGFRWGLDAGFDVFVEMDADGSHDPSELVALLAALKRSDMVLGSRWVGGGVTVNWPKSREILSRVGNTYTRFMLRLGMRDLTGGYRAYSAEALRSLDFEKVESHGYCFQIDIVLRAVKAGLKVAEIPITFTERTRGSSKMNGRIVIEALWRVTKWGVAAKLGRGVPSRASRRTSPAAL